MCRVFLEFYFEGILPYLRGRKEGREEREGEKIQSIESQHGTSSHRDMRVLSKENEVQEVRSL